MSTNWDFSPAGNRTRLLKEQPEWEELERRLMAIGGKSIAYRYEEDMSDLVLRGQAYSADSVIFVPRVAGRCHENVARLYASRRGQGFQIVTGWALSDGEWVQHSWGFEDGSVVETTIAREAYYGFILSKSGSAFFCDENADLYIPD